MAPRGSICVDTSGGELARSRDHLLLPPPRPTWSLQRDIPAATTVGLPADTKARDIAEASIHRVVVGTDTGATIHVSGIDRGFLLGDDFFP
ncbi:MAG TPA: hypothetical protein VIL34_15015 [Actinopolymorphaceae bacterium]|jgi:hypothetical protein